jgi:hypothetical protein
MNYKLSIKSLIKDQMADNRLEEKLAAGQYYDYE